jgi:hypothetical protein
MAVPRRRRRTDWKRILKMLFVLRTSVSVLLMKRHIEGQVDHIYIAARLVDLLLAVLLLSDFRVGTLVKTSYIESDF